MADERPDQPQRWDPSRSHVPDLESFLQDLYINQFTSVEPTSAQFSALSQRVSVLENRVSVNSAAGGGSGSVTSQELSVAAAALSVRIDTVSNAVSIVSNALSALSQATSVADAALSVRIDTQSQGISALSNQVSVLSNLHSALSQAVSVLSVQVVSALSIANAASAAAAAVSADLTSTRNILSNQISVLSQQVSALSQSVSSQVAALSVRIDTQSQSISVLSQQVSALSQDVSARFVSVNQSISVLSQSVSVLSQAVSAMSNTMSAISARMDTLSNAGSVLSQAVSVLSQTVSAMSNTVSAISARMDTLSNAVSVLSQAVSALSQAVSVLSAAGGGGISIVPTPGGRLTLTSATPVMTVAVAAAVKIFYTPYVSNALPIFNGTNWLLSTLVELEMSLDTSVHVSATNYDVFAVNDAGTRRIGSGPAWATTSTRALSLVRLNGLLVNASVISALRYGSLAVSAVASVQATYLGTFRTTSVSGQTEYSFGTVSAAPSAQLFLWNMYNRVAVAAMVRESADSWTWNQANWRQARGGDASGLQIGMVRGLDEDAVRAAYITNIAGSADAAIAIGVDSTTAFSGVTGINVTAAGLQAGSSWSGLPGIGYHFLAAIEYSGTGTATFYGDIGLIYNQGGLTALLVA